VECREGVSEGGLERPGQLPCLLAWKQLSPDFGPSRVLLNDTERYRCAGK
jgi:hypothetical protein